MYLDGRIIVFFVAEAILAFLFGVRSIYIYFRFRKQYSEKGYLSASNIGIAVIILNTILYVLLTKSFPGFISSVTQGLIGGLFLAWGLFCFVLLYNGQRICDCYGMKGYKASRFVSKDLLRAIVIVIGWTILFGKIIKPAVLHRPLLSFDLANISFTWNGFFVPVLMYCIIMPINEEILFRHGVMTVIMELFKGKKSFMSSRVVLVSAVVVSVIFSLAHMQGNYLLKVVQIFPIAMTLALIYRRQNLWQSILVHALFNFLNYLI